MSPSSRSNGQRGFSLIELTVAMAILVVILVLSLVLLVTMRSFADRQQLFAQPRQSARRAVEYVSYYARGATDMNSAVTPTAPHGNPAAILVWYERGGAANQGTYNNLTGAEFGNAISGPADLDGDGIFEIPDMDRDGTDDVSNFGDLGTDLITMAAPNNSGLHINFTVWPGNDLQAANARLNFRDGCPDDTQNMFLFMQQTGCYRQDLPGWPACTMADAASAPCPSCRSTVLTVADYQGNWALYQITGYSESGCNDANNDGDDNILGTADDTTIHVTHNWGGSEQINPPGGFGAFLNPPVFIGGGVRYVTFRVRGGRLEQKSGIFDPNTDNPGAAFIPLLDDVEDFQVAYVYDDGTVWNTPTSVLATANQVPPQLGIAAGVLDPRDIAHVVGLRITISTRSPREIPSQIFARHQRPAVEDRPAAATMDRVFHYPLTTTIMLRNRMLGR